MTARVKVSANFGRWIRGFDRLPEEVAEHGERAWRQAGEVFFDRTQEYVHVDKGELLESGHLDMRRGKRDVMATVAYDAYYAVYEFARGGSHDALTRGYEATARQFEQALPEAWKAVTATWR